MTAPTVRIYYEDSRTAGRAFTLHDVVLACVGDDLRRHGWELKHVVTCKPMNGNSKVLAECSRVGPKLKERHIAVVLDGDRLDRALDLRARYCKREAREAFESRIADRRFELFVLDENIETLLARLEELGDLFPLMREAREKDTDARDAVFSKAARLPEARRLIREVASFDRLIHHVAAWLVPS